ncbi:MAG TPA: hypothetical protein VL995_06040 [Cellvibrio sp.]|nr:hypothetical protein [Cellvibrio sp.]
MIRTILRTSSRLDNRWVLAEQGECDAILVYDGEKSFSPFVLKTTTELILIRRRGDHHDGHVFLKPFRAEELIDTLLNIEAALHPRPVHVQTAGSSTSVNFYRLKKWPPADILHKHKAYMLLAGYLSRGAKNLQDLVTFSGQAEDLCREFLQALDERNLLHVDSGRVTRAASSTIPASKIQDEKKSFLSLLRSKLGLSKK